jgi:hypothetical protein
MPQCISSQDIGKKKKFDFPRTGSCIMNQANWKKENNFSLKKIKIKSTGMCIHMYIPHVFNEF